MRNVIIAFVLLAGALLVVFLMSGKDSEMAQPEATQQETPVVAAPEPVEQVEEVVTEAVEDAAETAEEAATETAETTQEQAEEMVEDAVNEALGTTETATEAAESTAEAAETVTETVAEEATETAVPEMSDPLSVETFDMAKANEMIQGSSLDVLQQNTLKVALEQAQDNPELLKAALDQVKSALGL